MRRLGKKASRAWLLVLVWFVAIWAFSGEEFSAYSSSRLIG